VPAPTFSLRSRQFALFAFGISAAVNAEDPPLFPELTPAPASPTSPEALTSSRPASFYASSGATANSALVHDQAAAFWGADPIEAFISNPLQWGPFQLRPFGSYRFTYGNGLNVTPGNQVKTALHEISPGAVLQSRHLSFRYAPSLKYYSSDAFEDSVDHAASANANFGAGDWFFTLSHAFSKTRSPLIETGAQTPQESHNTTLSAHFQHSEKTSFDFSLSQSLQEAQALNSSKSWSSMNWANYHWTDKTLVGVGAGGGYTKQDFGADMTHEQLQARLGWTPGTKLSVNLNGGLEFRQFVDSAFDDQVNPLFGASISYTPWEATTFSLSANKSVGSSVLEAQTTETTSVSAGFRQRFLGVLNLDLFGGFNQQDYQGFATTGSTLETDRSDDILSFSASLGCEVFKRGDISVFYQHSKNDSSAGGYTYDSDQYGFQLAYHF
jgi:hypothetical protein